MAYTSGGMHEALRDEWRPVFTRVPTDVREVRDFLQSLAVRWDVGGWETLGVEDFRVAAKRAKQSAPGPDGIGYRFWVVEDSAAPVA